MTENLPPLPSRDDLSPQACEVIQVYLAVLDDLTPDQVRIIAEHAARCERCSLAHQQLKRAAQLVASLPISTPSARVDDAVMVAIMVRARSGSSRISEPLQPIALSQRKMRKEQKVGRL